MAIFVHSGFVIALQVGGIFRLETGRRHQLLGVPAASTAIAKIRSPFTANPSGVMFAPIHPSSILTAEAEAERNHWRGVIAVVDDGRLIIFERMDHAAMTASVELTIGNARSAALFKKSTQDLRD